MGVIIKALGRLLGQLHDMTYTMPLAELRAVIIIMYGSWCLAGIDKGQEEGHSRRRSCPFPRIRVAELGWGWTLEENLDGNQRGRLEGPFNYSAKVR